VWKLNLKERKNPAKRSGVRLGKLSISSRVTALAEIASAQQQKRIRMSGLAKNRTSAA